MKLITDLRAGIQELVLRWKEPLNTFWRRALIVFTTLGTTAAFITELIIPILLDPEASTDIKEYLRPFYTFLMGFAAAAKITAANHEALKAKKLKQEFKEKIEA